MIEFDDFSKVDIRVGTVVKAEPFPEARKSAYKLWLDFGEEFGIKKTSAQITDKYSLNDLIGRQLLAVINFAPRQIGPFMSEVLVLGLSNEDGQVILIAPDQVVPLGGKLH